MKMKKAVWILFLLTGILWGCGDHKKEFVVDGTINNLGGHPLYAVYELGNRLVIDTLRPNNGYISLRNVSDALIPIQFYYSNRTPFIKVYAQNGDRIELSGDGKEPFGITVKGGGLNKQLFEFNHAHKELLQTWLAERNKAQSGLKSVQYQQAYQELERAVVDYVSQNPKNQLSAVLVGDYLLGEADEALCDSLIGLLSEEVLSAPLASSIKIYQEFQAVLATDSILPALQWVTPADTTEYLEPGQAIATLLYFGSDGTPSTDRRYQSFLEECRQKYSSDTLQLFEISLDRDSAAWREKIKNDTVSWALRWIQESYANMGVKQLHIHRVPYLIVADSTGHIISRGLSPDSSAYYIEQMIYPDSIDSSNRK